MVMVGWGLDIVVVVQELPFLVRVAPYPFSFHVHEADLVMFHVLDDP